MREIAYREPPTESMRGPACRRNAAARSWSSGLSSTSTRVTVRPSTLSTSSMSDSAWAVLGRVTPAKRMTTVTKKICADRRFRVSLAKAPLVLVVSRILRTSAIGWRHVLAQDCCRACNMRSPLLCRRTRVRSSFESRTQARGGLSSPSREFTSCGIASCHCHPVVLSVSARPRAGRRVEMHGPSGIHAASSL